MKLKSIDLIVTDVKTTTDFFRDVVGLEPTIEGERYAQFDCGHVTLMLSPDAMVPTESVQGVIIHFEVADVKATIEAVRQNGAKVLLEPSLTDWGWETAMIQGPDSLIVDFYCQIEQPNKNP